MSEYTAAQPHTDAPLAQARARAATATQRAQQLAETDPALTKMAEYQCHLGELAVALADETVPIAELGRLTSEHQALETRIRQHQPAYDAAFAAYCELAAAAQDAGAEVAYYQHRISVAEQQLTVLAEEERLYLADLAKRRAAVRLELDRCVGDPGSPALTAERRAREENEPSTVAERRRVAYIADLRQKLVTAQRAGDGTGQVSAIQALEAIGEVA